MVPEQIEKAKRRDILVGVLLAALVAVAYQEMVTGVWESVRNKSFGFGTIATAGIFALTNLRFLIGNQMYLLQGRVQELHGYLWFCDLLLIVTQIITIIFLGGLVPVEKSLELRYSFFHVLAFLYVLDLSFILTLWPRKYCIKKWKDFRLPWGWFVLNGAMLLLLLLLGWHGKPALYSDTILAWILGANIVAFFADVFLFDNYDVI